MTTDAIGHALTWLATETSATRDEFRQAMPDGAHLLPACINLGYVRHKNDRVALTDAGLRREADHAAP